MPAPTIAGADVVGMRTDAVTVVEGGTETRLHAQTFIASLDRYVCLVSLVTDPGSPQTPLGPDFAAHLLTDGTQQPVLSGRRLTLPPGSVAVLR